MLTAFIARRSKIAMLPQAEQKRIEANLAVIRAYLKKNFPDCVLTEIPEEGIFYKFAVMNQNLGKHYKLNILRMRLSDHGNTSASIQTELESHNVAGRMVQATDYFMW